MKKVLDTIGMAVEWLRLEWPSKFFTKNINKNHGRHLALFAWALPPNTNAGVHRPLSFIRYGSLLGWQIDAFHGEAPANQSQHGDELLSRVPNNARLNTVPKSKLQPAYRLTPKVDGGFINALDSARHAIKSLSSNPPDFVLASGPPFYMFIAAYYVAKHFRVPLVLDYRDEWTECPFDFVSAGPQDRFWERRCLSAADAVFFTTQSHLDHQLEKFPELRRNKAHLLPNGWEPDDFTKNYLNKTGEVRRAMHQVEIAHVGNLAGHTPPGAFLNSLEELLSSDEQWRDRVHVSFIGRRSPEAESMLSSFPYKTNIEIIDHLPKLDANSKMQEADILLLISSPDLERYLPGKLFDYIAARQPTLVFGSPGESSRIVESLKVGKLCKSGSGLLLGNAIDELVKHDFVGEDAVVQKWLENHRRDLLAKQAFDIIALLGAGILSEKKSNKVQSTT